MSDNIYEAKSVEEALSQAAKELGVPLEELDHEVVEDGQDDFWGLGESTVKVRAWVPADEPEPQPEPEPAPAPEAQPVESAGEDRAATETSPAEPEPEPAAPDTPSAPEDEPEPRAVAPAPDADGTAAPRPSAHTVEEVEDLPRAVAGLLNRVFEAMDFDCRAEARLYEEQLHVAISGEDNQYLLEGRGRGLSALELLLNHGFRHRDAAEGTKIRVDAGDFKSQQEDEIRDLAYQVAHQAKETGEPQETRSLNPYERRIVHLTLADDPRVTTRSQGDDFMKVVMVIPD